MNPGKLEEFIEFIHIHSCTGANIAEQLRSLLERLGLDINNIHAKGMTGQPTCQVHEVEQAQSFWAGAEKVYTSIGQGIG